MYRISVIERCACLWQAPKPDPTEQEPAPELEASRVKEAALDDKLGVELRSIVEQIQVMVDTAR